MTTPKPEPAPEPKQGSVEPIQPVTELEAEKSTSKILRTQLALAVAETDEARATKDMHKERQEEAWAEVTALRARLAEVEELRKYIRRRDKSGRWGEERNALRAEVERLQGIIMGSSTESRVTLGVNLRRYWSAEDQVMLGRMLFDEDVPKLRAEVEELCDVLGEVLDALRVHAPGTALNSREFDFLGYKARAILANRKEGSR